MRSLNLVEITLIQIIFYGILWLTNDYLATYLSIVLATIFFFILLVSLLVELVAPSKVPRWYYLLMIASILAPIIASLGYILLTGGELDWTDGI